MENSEQTITLELSQSSVEFLSDLLAAICKSYANQGLIRVEEGDMQNAIVLLDRLAAAGYELPTTFAVSVTS